MPSYLRRSEGGLATAHDALPCPVNHIGPTRPSEIAARRSRRWDTESPKVLLYTKKEARLPAHIAGPNLRIGQVTNLAHGISVELHEYFLKDRNVERKVHETKNET